MSVLHARTHRLAHMPSPPCPSKTLRPIRAEIKRDTGYYPNTPLSVNHAIMKGKPLRPDEDVRAPNMPQINYFSAKKYGTPAAMGITGKAPCEAAAEGKGIPM